MKTKREADMLSGPLKIEYTVQLWREGSQFVADAMPLDVMSVGATPQTARQALDEAVGLFLKTAADMEQVLEDAGYVLHDNSWEGPDWVGVERHTLSVVA